MQLIDWHRFVVLETLDFDPGEVYPAPARTIQEINVILNTENRGDIKVTLADDVTVFFRHPNSSIFRFAAMKKWIWTSINRAEMK